MHLSHKQLGGGGRDLVLAHLRGSLGQLFCSSSSSSFSVRPFMPPTPRASWSSRGIPCALVSCWRSLHCRDARLLLSLCRHRGIVDVGSKVESGKLRVKGVLNQENPLSSGDFPLGGSALKSHESNSLNSHESDLLI